MKLSQLFSIYPYLKWGDKPTREITGICIDSRQAQPGVVFVALRGTKTDSHQFLPEVCKKGVAGVIVENDKMIPQDFEGAVVVVKDSAEALGKLASRYFGNPGEKLFCVGVTGTNGKTTVTHFIESIFEEYGWQTGVMGTINHHIGKRQWKTDNTTSDALTLQKRLEEFRSLGAQAVSMEISSHAISQKRVEGLSLDVAVFTNLTRDHLDFHKDMEDYFRSKERLFSDLLMNSSKEMTYAIINNDDPYGKKIGIPPRAKLLTYGERACDITFQIRNQDFNGTFFEVITPREMGEIFLPMVGTHNVYNALAAIGVGLAAGISLEKCVKALEKIKGVSGRLQPIENPFGLYIFIDYAHTDQALEKVLESLKNVRRGLKKTGRIIAVFGCGGDRDQGKRPMMGKVAYEGSDLIFVTSDNPRTENPKKIIDDILEGMPSQDREKVFVEVDRSLAIERALRTAGEGDVILIAGKGHENYQVIGTEEFEYSDAKVVREVLDCLGR